MDYLLALRANLVNYVNLIDIVYAPCIVSTSAWNDETNMRRYCGASEDLFHHHVLSKNNEAFLLLVFINYTGYWLSEMQIKKSEVRLCACALCCSSVQAYLFYLLDVVVAYSYLMAWQTMQ